MQINMASELRDSSGRQKLNAFLWNQQHEGVVSNQPV